MKRFSAPSFVLLLALAEAGSAQEALIGPPQTACCAPCASWCLKPRACRVTCQTCLGDFLRFCLTPLRHLCGWHQCDGCPQEIACELSLAEMTATRIRADEAGANARRAAVRYLGSVDCHYYPEAEPALVAALRGDRSECVRLEAAKALAKGCCWTHGTIEALNLVVTGRARDGNPAETSERVKMFALQALCRSMASGFAFPVSREMPPKLLDVTWGGSAGSAGPPVRAKGPTRTAVEDELLKPAAYEAPILGAPRPAGLVPIGEGGLIPVRATVPLPGPVPPLAAMPTPPTRPATKASRALTPIGVMPD